MYRRDPLDSIVLTIGAFLFWVNGDNYAAAPRLIRMSADFNIGIAQAASIVTAYLRCFGRFTMVFFPLGDRFGKARILRVAAAGSAIASLVSAFYPSLSALITVRAVNGGFSAGIMAVAMALVGERSPQESRHAYIGRAMGFMFLGGAAAAAIGGAHSQYGSWRLVYAVYGIAELALLVPLFILVPAETRPAATGVPNSGTPRRAVPRRVWPIDWLLLLIGFSTLGTFAIWGQILRDRTDYGLLAIGLILSAYGFGTLAGGRAAGKLRARLGPARFPLAGVIGGGGFLLFGLGAENVAIALPGLFAAGFCFVCIHSAIVTAIQDLLAPLRGLAMSIASLCMVTSGALGTSVNGRPYLAGGGVIPFLAAVGLVLAGGAAAFALAPGAGKAEPNPSAKPA